MGKRLKVERQTFKKITGVLINIVLIDFVR